MSPGGRHGHTVRRLRRRMDAVLEEDRERRRPPPAPISQEHAAMRERIGREWGAIVARVPEGMDLQEACLENPDLANASALVLVEMRKEAEFLASQGVDPRPYYGRN